MNHLDEIIVRYLGAELEQLEAETPLPPPPRLPTPYRGTPRLLHLPPSGADTTQTVPPPARRSS